MLQTYSLKFTLCDWIDERTNNADRYKEEEEEKTSSAETENSLDRSMASWRMNSTIWCICFNTSPSSILASSSLSEIQLQFPNYELRITNCNDDNYDSQKQIGNGLVGCVCQGSHLLPNCRPILQINLWIFQRFAG